MRLFGLVLLILLATIGLGFGAGVPVTPSYKKEETIEVSIELLDSDSDQPKLSPCEAQLK